LNILPGVEFSDFPMEMFPALSWIALEKPFVDWVRRLSAPA